ncbi:MAG: hypothetical protein O3A53_14745 [Acidobacteria bacterium]|nr:hypothetical protein [Acidobacteriota bacterium]MDA1236043.1 hypothetical protein [Acidobacteriota bacterium]
MKLIKNILVALVLITAVWRLDASTVVPLNFDELSRASNTVVAGEVVDITADRDANGYIYSTVTLRVAEAVPQTLVGTDYVFRMIGGTLNGQSTSIQGMPKFAVGDGLILFLNESTDSAMGPTVGLWQGVFHLDSDSGVSDSSRQLVVGVEGARLMRAIPAATVDGAGVAASSVGSRKAMNAGSFMDAVRDARSR